MLPEKKLERINELAKKAKQKGLNTEEQEEQRQLRQEYLQKFRGSFKSHLMNVKVVDPEGTDVTPQKLKREQRKRKKH